MKLRNIIESEYADLEDADEFVYDESFYLSGDIHVNPKTSMFHEFRDELLEGVQRLINQFAGANICVAQSVEIEHDENWPDTESYFRKWHHKYNLRTVGVEPVPKNEDIIPRNYVVYDASFEFAGHPDDAGTVSDIWFDLFQRGVIEMSPNCFLIPM